MPLLATERVKLPYTDLLSWMFDEVIYDIDRPILIDAANTSRTISCRQARSMIQRIAAGLKKTGLQHGDCVCIHAFNDIYYPIACLGVVAAGGIYAGTNPSYTVSELEYYTRIANIRYWIVEPALLPNVQRAAARSGIPTANIFGFGPSTESLPAGIRSWEVLQNCGEVDWERFDNERRAATEPVVRLFSSGTTGLPKAVDLTHLNCTSQHTVVMEHRKRPYEVRRLICNAMFHVSQVAKVNTSAFRGGYPTYLMRRFELEPWMANISKFNITELNVVPAMVVTILQSGLLEKYSLDCVKNIYSGSAPLDKSLQMALKAYLPADCIFNLAWGMTETSCMGMCFFYPDQDLTGAVGRPLPNHDVKLVDDNGNEITESNMRGELCIRGPSIFNGYGREKLRKDFDADGFFHTGDIAYRDPISMLWYIVDRKKELIKVRGFQVSPAEIEAVLVNHPGVAEAAVIGVQESAETSEFPRAYIVPKKGASLTVESVKAFAAERLAGYKMLHGGVKFVSALPRNINQKVLKNVLREQAKKELRLASQTLGQESARL
ncbi:uncharacterized protein Z520_02690 [Fonsecaea multimorphosa CBS 102226]|uniref:AMP-dependent synthetase/ligase domain-containing protein n=1 Tax=Fonsecaea multimorphosa CBS 102226 TaxID=1442371 RepID=A0A0D2K5P6_9EURO|nr:uncharacterized protein Z520_02690 [Fonsecaea multimorphosa CBS 102226]KIY01138.1 hypothetical protein Z520_02690 [Fonsecaea multimorphosa CBS 102226]OAL28757.1 hypothetical protein AYO22_02622 [Fonsecaea multimorphosa]